MPLEIEIKLNIEDLPGFRRRLESVSPKLLASRHFEENSVLDFPAGTIRSRGCLVRVRRTGECGLLTFKKTPIEAGRFKVREEIETEVADAEAALKVLEGLGLEVWFRYEKYREEFIVPTTDGDIHVAVDETPVGVFAELEGSEHGIRCVAEALGYSETEFLRESYYALYVRWCRQRGIPPTDMVFEPVSRS